MDRARRATAPADTPSSHHYVLDELNGIAVQVHGPCPPSRQDLAGAPQAEQAPAWCPQVQEHFEVGKDEHGHKYLHHRDDSPVRPHGRPGRNRQGGAQRAAHRRAGRAAPVPGLGRSGPPVGGVPERGSGVARSLLSAWGPGREFLRGAVVGATSSAVG